MYRDVAQWTGIRRRILREGVSIRQVGRETGISCETICKMLKHPVPKPYGPRDRRYPKLGPHTVTVQRLLRENVVESEEVGLSPFLRPLAQTARAVFPQAAFLCGRLR